MSDYTIKNFKDDIPDSAAARAPIEEGLESHFGRGYLDCEHLGVSYFRYAPGRRSSFGHRHREQEEVYVVTAGSGRIKLDGDIEDLQAWDAVRVAPQVVRAFEAGTDGLEMIAISTDLPTGGDAERFADVWED